MKIWFRKAWNNIHSLIKQTPRAACLLWDCSPAHTLCYLLITLFYALITPVQLLITKMILNNLIASFHASTVQYHLREIIGLIVLQAVIWSLSNVAGKIDEVLRRRLGEVLQQHVNILLLQKAGCMDLSFFENPELINQYEFAAQQSQRAMHFVGYFAAIIRVGISLFTLLIMLWPLSWLAPFVILAVSIPRIIVQAKYTKRKFKLLFCQTQNSRIANYLSILLSTRENMKEIQLLDLKDHIWTRWHNASIRMLHEQNKLQVKEEIVQTGWGVLSTIGTGGIWMYAALRAVAHRISLGSLLLYMQAASQIRFDLASLFQYTGIFYETTQRMASLFQFLDLDPSSITGALAAPRQAEAPLPAPKPFPDRHSVSERLLSLPRHRRECA